MSELVEVSEHVCNKCGGVGSIIVRITYRNHKREECPKCKGTGKLNWIERITGKKNAKNK